MVVSEHQSISFPVVMEMLEFFPLLNILHCGGEEEVKFITYLEEIIAITPDVPFTLEYTEFQEQQDRKEIVYHDAEKFKNNELPLVILISKEFFDLMWTCTRKQDLLDIITSENVKHCLHIWLDVNEAEVKTRSKNLLSQEHNFKRVISTELTNGVEASTAITMIRKLLHESTNKNIASDNYAIDDEEEAMRVKFFEEHRDLVPEASTNPTGPAKKKKKKKGNVYSDALRIASMTEEEQQAYVNNRDETEDTQSTSRR